MAPKHGLTVSAGAGWSIDFSALGSPATSPARLAARSTSTDPTTAQITLYITAAVLLVIGIFCALVGVFWWRGNVARKKRRVVLLAGAGGSDGGKGKYGVLKDQEKGYTGYAGYVEADGGGGVLEMQGEGLKRPMELDGFVAAPRPAARAELS